MCEFLLVYQSIPQWSRNEKNGYKFIFFSSKPLTYNETKFKHLTTIIFWIKTVTWAFCFWAIRLKSWPKHENAQILKFVFQRKKKVKEIKLTKTLFLIKFKVISVILGLFRTKLDNCRQSYKDWPIAYD